MTGEIAALAAALAFGLSIVLAQRFMSAVPPESGVLVSTATNTAVFVTLTLGLVWTGRLPPVAPASVGLFVFGGLAGTLVGRNLTYVGIGRIGAAMSTSIRLSNSVFTLLFGLLVLHELPRNAQLVGLGIVTLGLWMVVWSRTGPRGARRATMDLGGIAMAVGGAAAFALGDTARRMGLMMTPAPVLGAALGASSALVAHLLWSTRRRTARWPTGAALRRADLWGSATANTVAILLLFIGLRHAPVAIVSVLYNLQVLVVLLISPIVLRGQDTVTGGLVLGTLLALTGTVLILLG